MKYSFRNDYSELAHPKILELMLNNANEQNIGYGLDKHSERAKLLIKKFILYLLRNRKIKINN